MAKRLSIFLVTLLVSGATVTAYGLPNCADLSNVWNYQINYAPPLVTNYIQMTLSQDNSQNPPTISGAITDTNDNGIAGNNCTGTITGSGGNGSWSITVHVVTGPCSGGTYPVVLYSNGYCTTGQIANQYFMNAQMCLVPGTNNGAAGTSGETFASASWKAIPDDGATHYTFTLKPPTFTGYTGGSTYKWGGHYYTEDFDSDAGDPVPCRPQLIWLPTNAHYLDSSDQYGGNGGYDDVGYPPDDAKLGQAGGEIAGVQRMNQKDIYPCGGKTTQHMRIGCPTGPVEYEVHPIERQIVSDIMIVVKRNGVAAVPSPHAFGWTRATWLGRLHWTYFPNLRGFLF